MIYWHIDLFDMQQMLSTFAAKTSLGGASADNSHTTTAHDQAEADE
jgi:hypothetical protein